MDIAQALAGEITVATGLLPENCLWWRNSKSGEVHALYEPPSVRTLLFKSGAEDKIQKFTIPLPGLIFFCQSCRAPWVFAVKHKPTKESDEVFKAPLLNVFENGSTCGGSQRYPERIEETIHDFFASYFTNAATVTNRSKSHMTGILGLWRDLHKKKVKEFPLTDLIPQCTVGDLLRMKVG